MRQLKKEELHGLRLVAKIGIIVGFIVMAWRAIGQDWGWVLAGAIMVVVGIALGSFVLYYRRNIARPERPSRH